MISRVFRQIALSRVHVAALRNAASLYPVFTVDLTLCRTFSTSVVRTEQQVRVSMAGLMKLDTHDKTSTNVVDHSEAVKQMQEINAIDSLLSFGHQQSFDVSLAKLFLTRMVQLNANTLTIEKALKADLLTDPVFTKIGNVLMSEGTLQLSTSAFLDCLEHLLLLSVTDSKPVENLERLLIKQLPSLPVSYVVRVALIHSQLHHGTDLRRNVCETAFSTLEQRWNELTSAKDIVTLFYIADGRSDVFQRRLENTAMSLCASFSTKDLYRILYVTGKRRHRNVPLLRALTYHLNRQPLSLSLQHTANLAFACARLQFFDANLLSNISQTGLAKASQAGIASARNSALLSILQSFSLLRWRDCNFIDSTVDIIMSNTPELSLDEWGGLLRSMANLAYVPRMAVDIFMASKHHSGPHSDRRVWLDIVWNCALLSSLSSDMPMSVLCTDFLQECDMQALDGTCQKLLGINAAARHMMAQYTGPYLSSETVTQFMKQVSVRGRDALFESVIAALSAMAPAEKYLRMDVVTPAGCIIDIEMLVNGRGEPQPISEYHSAFDTSGASASLKELPPDFHRIAIKLLGFTDVTSYSVVPTGYQAFTSKYLSLLGYKVVQVSYTELDAATPVAKSAKYLMTKLKASLPKVGSHVKRVVY